MAGHGNSFTEAQRQRRRYEAVRKDRDYWKDRATAKNDAAYKDGVFVGVAATFAFALIGSIVLLAIFG